MIYGTKLSFLLSIKTSKNFYVNGSYLSFIEERTSLYWVDLNVLSFKNDLNYSLYFTH